MKQTLNNQLLTDLLIKHITSKGLPTSVCLFKMDWLDGLFYRLTCDQLKMMEERLRLKLLQGYQVETIEDYAIIFCSKTNALRWVPAWIGHAELIRLAVEQDQLNQHHVFDLLAPEFKRLKIAY